MCLCMWAGDGLCLEFVRVCVFFFSVNAKKGKNTFKEYMCVCVCVCLYRGGSCASDVSPFLHGARFFPCFHPPQISAVAAAAVTFGSNF